MGYQELGEVETVILGGKNKETGKNNPTELEGYYLRREERANRFNPTKPQLFYVFQTPKGEQGVYGKAGLDKVLKGATIGAMTKIVATGETIDTGKGNPMKVFKAYQDRSNTIEVAATSESNFSWDSHDTDADQELFDDSTQLDEVPVARPSAPKKPATPVNSERAAKIQAMLGNRHKA